MEILEKLTYRFFYKFLNAFISRKFLITWRKITTDYTIEDKFYLSSKGKVGVFLTSLTHFKEKIGDYYVRPIRPTAWTSAEYYYGFNTEQINFLFIIFLLTEEELKRSLENKDSLLDIPDKEFYEKSTDIRYREHVEKLMREQKWRDKDLVDVYERVISKNDERNLENQKIKLKEPIDKLCKRFKRNDPDLSPVMYKYAEIMSKIIAKYDKDGIETVSQYSPNIKDNQSPDDILTVKEAADYVSRSDQTIYSWTSNKLIGFHKDRSGRIKIKRKELDKYMQIKNIKSTAEIRGEAKAASLIEKSFGKK